MQEPSLFGPAAQDQSADLELLQLRRADFEELVCVYGVCRLCVLCVFVCACACVHVVWLTWCSLVGVYCEFALIRCAYIGIICNLCVCIHGAEGHELVLCLCIDSLQVAGGPGVLLCCSLLLRQRGRPHSFLQCIFFEFVPV